jgi:hypothetical protein
MAYLLSAALVAACQPQGGEKAQNGTAMATELDGPAAAVTPDLAASDLKFLMQSAEAENEQCRGGHGDDPETMHACNRRQELLVRLERRGWCFEETGDKRWLKCANNPDYRPGQYGSEPLPARMPAKLEEMEYLEARKVIVGYGWQPLTGDCSGPDVSAQTCARYPEVGNCTGVGIGLCDMTFVRRDRCLVVVTVGGAPQAEAGDTTVRDVSFQRGPCSKEPNAGR